MISRIILLFRKDDFQVPSDKFSGVELCIFANKFLWKQTYTSKVIEFIHKCHEILPTQTKCHNFEGEKIPQNLPRHFGCFVLNFPLKKRVPLNDFPCIHFQHEPRKKKQNNFLLSIESRLFNRDPYNI